MNGELASVWPETWRYVWSPLAKHAQAPTDLFPELFRAFVKPPLPPSSPESPASFDEEGVAVSVDYRRALASYEKALARYGLERANYDEGANDPAAGRRALRTHLYKGVRNDIEARTLLTAAYEVIDGYGSDALTTRFFLLIETFIAHFSLRYDLRRPFTFHRTPEGVYANLYVEIASLCREDAGLAALLRDYREAFQDLAIGQTSGRISTCLQKQVNLLEGITSLSTGVNEKTLGKMCNEIQTWPSTAVSEAAKSMYGFASDHSGLRHGTIKKAKEGKTPIVHRDMNMRDLVAVSAFFTGLSAYLSDKIDPLAVFGE